MTVEVTDRQETMRVRLRGHQAIDNEIRNDLVEDIDRVLHYLRDRYCEAHRAPAKKVPVRLSDISKELKIDRPRVAVCVHYAKLVALLESTPDLTDPEACVIATENLAGFRNLSHWSETRAGKLYPQLFESAQRRPKKPQGNVETSATKREVILAAALWVIKHDYKAFPRLDRLSGAKIVDRIEFVKERWWSDEKPMPARRTMVDLINKCLKNKTLKI